MRRDPIALAAALAVALAAAPALAADPAAPAPRPPVPREAPLWEAGIGMAGLAFPDYRGASHSRGYALPAPYLVYRGDLLEADRRGLRALFVRTDRLDVDVSVGASLPVDSSRDPERAGMPDLKPSVEFGPSLEVTLWRSARGSAELQARFPLRGAVTVESDPRYIGGEFFPHVNLDLRTPSLHGWNLGLLGGVVLNDARYNRYYYEVPAAYATPERPAYTPAGGYGGTQFIAAISKRYPRFWVGAFVRYDNLRGATFAASPLVGTKDYVAGGVAISWILGESRERVPVAGPEERRR